MTELDPAPEPTDLRDLAADLARQAGRLLLAGRAADLAVTAKSSPSDYVTVMDRASERLIRQGLREKRRHDTILAEESGTTTGTSRVRWIVDPLDGTVNYVYRRPAYGVSIAAELDGRVVAGVVYDPSHDLLYEAVRGQGARVNGDPVACGTAGEVALALVGTGFSYSATARARQGEVIARLIGRVRDIRRSGAAALDLCAVADGRLDAFFEAGLQPWDSAAGELIATEAGALTTRFTTPYGELLVAAAPGVFDEFVRTLRHVHPAASPASIDPFNW